VTNLPVIHPLLRQLANAIGLGALLTRNTRLRSQSHPSQSGINIDNSKVRSRKAQTHPLSVSNNIAWASDEHILPTDDQSISTAKECSSGIVVAHEVSVRSELVDEREFSPDSGRLGSDDWRSKNMACIVSSEPTDDS
jgi:hypothetical protein